MTLDAIALQENREQHITLGLTKGLSLGVLATAIAGPEIADIVVTIAQNGFDSEWLSVYKHCLDLAQNHGSGIDRYVISRVTSLPVVAGITTAIGFADGVNHKIKEVLGYKSAPKVQGNTWYGRNVKIAFTARKYVSQGINKNEAIYSATRDVCAKLISQVAGINDEEETKSALELIADEKTRFKKFEDEKGLLRAKGDVIQQVADYAAHPDTYTFYDRCSVTGYEKELAALAAPFWPMVYTYEHTQSIAQTIAVGFASLVAGFVGSVYIDSAVNCQLLSNELKEWKEGSRILYENFLSKINSK